MEVTPRKFWRPTEKFCIELILFFLYLLDYCINFRKNIWNYFICVCFNTFIFLFFEAVFDNSIFGLNDLGDQSHRLLAWGWLKTDPMSFCNLGINLLIVAELSLDQSLGTSLYLEQDLWRDLWKEQKMIREQWLNLVLLFHAFFRIFLCLCKSLHEYLIQTHMGGANILVQWGQNYKTIYNYGIIV